MMRWSTRPISVMIVKTENSTYILVDKGDGAFRLSSDNPKYKGPCMASLERPILVGHGLVMRFITGPKRGRYLITSPITQISGS